MKKFIIALAIAGVFILYSLGIRHKSPVLTRPSSLAVNTSSASSSAGSSSNTSSGASNGASSGSGSTSPSAQYKDGNYTGSVANAYYGNVQVEATISGGKLTAVKFLQYPNTHSTSVLINQQAIPYLQQEAIQAQSSKVQLISGATFTSQAFTQSLANALSQANL
ncbi:MAG TPA: FMN-binding protein [Patescibacteria group bacterium]|jgi:uncharacterized protein with FMN-binding domain|nr:FMN-binding protein [Patescibacteria group bacterium]